MGSLSPFLGEPPLEDAVVESFNVYCKTSCLDIMACLCDALLFAMSALNLNKDFSSPSNYPCISFFCVFCSLITSLCWFTWSCKSPLSFWFYCCAIWSPPEASSPNFSMSYSLWMVSVSISALSFYMIFKFPHNLLSWSSSNFFKKATFYLLAGFYSRIFWISYTG